MRIVLVGCLAAMLFVATGCATVTGNAKPTGVWASTQLSEQGRFQPGLDVSFDNGHTLGAFYRTGDEVGDDGFFFTYRMPIWTATPGGRWGEGKLINPIDPDVFPLPGLFGAPASGNDNDN